MGAMENEDERNGGQRYAFDLCYVVTLVLVLFLMSTSNVHFYSSLNRFALAAGMNKRKQ